MQKPLIDSRVAFIRTDRLGSPNGLTRLSAHLNKKTSAHGSTIDSDDQASAAAVMPDLLPIIRRARILSDRQIDRIDSKILSGEFPRDTRALAERLVAEKLLTEFQSARLLRNKANGLVIGPYVVLDRLGEGNRGRVYKAEHKLMGRLVALKIIAPRIASRASSIARFHREMLLLGRLDHPNVVRSFDADQVGDLLYIIMEFVEGRTLEQVLHDRGSLAPTEVAGYMAQAALGLEHAHHRGIVHRDVKPTNLILSEDGRVKVLDLGLGALMEADSEASFATAAGLAVGTLPYMSPEQTRTSEIDCRSDLFSLGCTMYHLLTGQIPFPGETVVDCVTRLVTGKPVPIHDLRPDLPSEFVEVLEILMAKRPEERFQTAGAAADALHILAERAEPDRRPTPRLAIKSADAEPDTSPPSAGAMSPVAPFGGNPGHLPCAQSCVTASDALWRFPRVSLPLLIIGLLLFVVGFALGHTFASR